MIKYCRYCQYFRRNKKDISESICKAPQNVNKEVGDPYGYGGTGEFQPRVLNMKNKCKYYKKKEIGAIGKQKGWWPLFKKK